MTSSHTRAGAASVRFVGISREIVDVSPLLLYTKSKGGKDGWQMLEWSQGPMEKYRNDKRRQVWIRSNLLTQRAQTFRKQVVLHRVYKVHDLLVSSHTWHHGCSPRLTPVRLRSHHPHRTRTVRSHRTLLSNFILLLLVIIPYLVLLLWSHPQRGSRRHCYYLRDSSSCSVELL